MPTAKIYITNTTYTMHPMTPAPCNNRKTYLVGAGRLRAADEHLVHAAAHLQRLQVAGQMQAPQDLIVELRDLGYIVNVAVAISETYC